MKTLNESLNQSLHHLDYESKPADYSLLAFIEQLVSLMRCTN